MISYQRIKRQFFSRVWLARTVIATLILAAVLGGYQYIFRPLASRAIGFWNAYHMILPNYQGRTNFLVLGIAGDTRDGNQLTDTIILASVDQRTGDTVLISVPRDIWIPSLRAKINTAYYYGQKKQPDGGGLQLSKSAVSEVMGVPIQFVAIVDFRGFEKMIDLLGGVDATVDYTFVDDQYPIAGRENDTCQGDPKFACRYETIKFTQGLTHMDGATALKFARSRHAQGDEGTDFARSARQEKIIAAVRTKLLTGKVLTNKNLLTALYENFRQSVINDIDPQYYLPLARLAWTAWRQPMRSTNINDLFENPRISQTYDFQWVLVPKAEVSVTSYIKNFLAIPAQ